MLPATADLGHQRRIKLPSKVLQRAFPPGQALEQPGVNRVAGQEDVHARPQVCEGLQNLAQPGPRPVPRRLQVDDERHPFRPGFQRAQVERFQGALRIQVPPGMGDPEFISDPKDIDLDVGEAGLQGVEERTRTQVVVVRMPFYARCAKR